MIEFINGDKEVQIAKTNAELRYILSLLLELEKNESLTQKYKNKIEEIKNYYGIK